MFSAERQVWRERPLKREDAVRDIGALLDWIATQPDLDQNRVMVYGDSYGGYMVLASLMHYSNRLRGGVNIVGISDFITFLENTESYRRDLRRVEYGDERDPQMRAFFERISPLRNAERIRAPLLVIQGQNDPRVPVTEAEQIVQRVRTNGRPVWYMNALNEGHGYARKENQDLMRDVVALPEWVLQEEAEARGLILAHELEHLRARDPQLLLGSLLLAVATVWNLPLWGSGAGCARRWRWIAISASSRRA
jgi:acetyl esterase/lipase